jgi:zinc protease
MRTTNAAFAALLAGALLASPLLAAESKPLPRDLPPFGPDKPLPVPPIAQSKTAEGLTVWIVGRPGFPKVTAVLAVRGGLASDPRELPGVSQLLATTVKAGTPTRTAEQIAEQLQAVGGAIDTSIDEDAVTLTVDGLASGVSPLLSVLGDIAQHASFPAQEVELAKTNALQELDAEMAQPGFFGNRAMAEGLYGDHPYRTTAPTAAAIQATTPEILRAQFARRFRPERSLLVIVGDVDPAATSRAVNAAFAGWKTTAEAAPAVPLAPTAPNPGLLLVDRPGSVQSLILLGSSAPRMTDADYYPLLVANTIFGGSFGSRLTNNIREDKGYTYSPGSSLLARAEGGRLRVRADVRNEVTGASLNEMLYELNRMATTSPTAEEMKTAKRFQTGIYLIRNQIQEAVAGTLAANWLNGLPPESLSAFVPKVDAVTPADVDRVARAEMPANRQLIVVVGDAAKVKSSLEIYRPVKEYKP